MIVLRFLAAFAAVTLSMAATFVAVRTAGAHRDGIGDTWASLTPLELFIASAGGMLTWAAFRPGPFATVLFCLNAVSAAVSLTKMAPELIKLRPAFGREPPVLRVLSGNLYWLNPSGEKAVATILERDADAVILQEAGRRLRGALAALEARYPYVAACPHSDLVIYAKSPIVSHGCNCKHAETARGRLLTATVDLSSGPTVTLATTHLSHPYRGNEQAREREALAAAVNDLDLPRLILAGDFNSTPWSYGLRCQDEMLAPLRRWTIAWFTWPARLPKWEVAWPLPLLPLDHVYAGSLWDQVRLRRVRIPGSDHFATEAAFSIARARPHDRHDAR